VLFAGAVLFQLVTLPVEFDASRRGLAALTTTGSVVPGDEAGARQVLTAAALTYVASALISVLYLLQFIGIGRRRLEGRAGGCSQFRQMQITKHYRLAREW